MSDRSIYNALIAGGMTPAGACGMMGNMYAESCLVSNNVQDNCTLSDHDYTYAVNNGIITRWQFMADGFGYGLCQWTYPGRKDHLYMFAREAGVSIGNEEMQVQFCLWELKNDGEFAELYKYLCETNNVVEAAERICKQYEKPKVNNFQPRIEAARKYFAELASDGCNGDVCPITPAPIPEGETCQISVRVLRKGDKGRDVFLLQCGLLDIGLDLGEYGADGDFGKCTEDAVRELQKNCELEVNGIADQATWQILFQ